MNVPRVSLLRPSQDVAETLSTSHRVSVVGARLPILRSIVVRKEGFIARSRLVGKAPPCVWSISTVSGHASRRTLRRIPKHSGVTQDLSGDPNDRELEQGGVSTPLVERLR